MAGEVVYAITENAVSAFGHLVKEEDADAIAQDIRAILRDDSGREEAREAVSDLAATGFANSVLSSILEAPDTFAEWRVGEALAEHHLTNDRNCHFPWPESRSQRNPGSIGGGVDLIGFEGSEHLRFVLCEAKTSHHQSWPPSVVTNRSQGLHGQIAGLNAGDKRCQWAIKYLMMNGKDRDWFSNFRAALANYLADPRDLVIYGILIHVSDPNEADLLSESKSLSKSVESPTKMELIALYVTSEVLRRIAGAEISVETAA